MLQASFVALFTVAVGTPDPAAQAIVEAAAAAQRVGAHGAGAVLARHGFHPFATGQFDQRPQAEALGMTHCAPNGALWFCARLVARVVDQSPVHLAFKPSPGYALMHADAVDGRGRGHRLTIDAQGMVDLPPALGARWTLGVSTRGPAGPETALLLQRGGGAPQPADCHGPVDLSGLVARINGQRRALGVRPLRFEVAPAAYARQRSAELAKAFGHSPMGLPATLARHRLRLKHAAEVVAEDPSLAAICRGWMLSPSHRRALLDPRRDAIAFVQRGERLAALLWRGP